MPSVVIGEILRGRLNAIRRAESENIKLSIDRAYALFEDRPTRAHGDSRPSAKRGGNQAGDARPVRRGYRSVQQPGRSTADRLPDCAQGRTASGVARWEKGGFPTQGTWPEVFGGGAEADEVFPTWHYARYIDQMAEAGQQQYPLPMYVNTWLESRLGDYESRLPDRHPPVGGLVIQTAPEQFLVAGYGFNCRFEATTPGARRTEIESVELGRFDEQEKWIHEPWLNGDETGANYVARIPPSTVNEYLGIRRPMILRVTVYRHD